MCVFLLICTTIYCPCINTICQLFCACFVVLSFSLLPLSSSAYLYCAFPPNLSLWSVCVCMCMCMCAFSPWNLLVPCKAIIVIFMLCYAVSFVNCSSWFMVAFCVFPHWCLFVFVLVYSLLAMNGPDLPREGHPWTSELNIALLTWAAFRGSGGSFILNCFLGFYFFGRSRLLAGYLGGSLVFFVA